MAGALCLGTAVPAFAHEGASPSHTTGTSSAQFTPPTLDQQKAWATAWVDHWLSVLQKKTAKVAASDKLTDAQKAKFAASAASAAVALTNLKAAIAAATTSAQLKDALKAGWAQVNWPIHHGKPAPYRFHHHVTKHHHRATGHSEKEHAGGR